ncbi:MAG: hypothetical protein AAGM22_04230 [Acidobacteriota bacterium]
MRRLFWLVCFASLFSPAQAAHAWTPESQQFIAEQAARLVPPDLYRQLARNRPSFLVGVQEPFRSGAPQDLHARRDGRLPTAIELAVDHAIASIEHHHPFNDIAYRMGVVAHYVALAHQPLATGEGDAEQRRYHHDFARYLQSVEPRVDVVFYGFRAVDGPLDLEALVQDALRSSRNHYPLVGREYRRVGFRSGVQAFDDRSTAFALAALGYSHAVSDIAEVLRYIWLRAGGADGRRSLPQRGHHLVRLRPAEQAPRVR